MPHKSLFQISMQTGAWLVIAFLVLPMLVVIPVSLTDHSYISLPTDGLSLQHYENYFTNPKWIEATWSSLVIGLSVAAIATVLGTAFSVGCWFLSDFWANVARWLLITPILVPPVVQSLGFYRFWVQLGLIDSMSEPRQTDPAGGPQSGGVGLDHGHIRRSSRRQTGDHRRRDFCLHRLLRRDRRCALHHGPAGADLAEIDLAGHSGEHRPDHRRGRDHPDNNYHHDHDRCVIPPGELKPCRVI
jgi:hypothetical protein